MTATNEDAYTAPGGDGVEAMVSIAGDAVHRAIPISAFDADKVARAALESLGIPLEVLAELKSGARKAMRYTVHTLPSGREGGLPSGSDAYHGRSRWNSTPKTPSEV